MSEDRIGVITAFIPKDLLKARPYWALKHLIDLASDKAFVEGGVLTGQMRSLRWTEVRVDVLAEFVDREGRNQFRLDRMQAYEFEIRHEWTPATPGGPGLAAGRVSAHEDRKGRPTIEEQWTAYVGTDENREPEPDSFEISPREGKYATPLDFEIFVTGKYRDSDELTRLVDDFAASQGCSVDRSHSSYRYESKGAKCLNFTLVPISALGRSEAQRYLLGQVSTWLGLTP